MLSMKMAFPTYYKETYRGHSFQEQCELEFGWSVLADVVAKSFSAPSISMAGCAWWTADRLRLTTNTCSLISHNYRVHGYRLMVDRCWIVVT